VGRDLALGASYSWYARFNPRARVGRDVREALDYVADYTFQSTRPRGARRYRPRLTTSRQSSFNPRARVGRDRCGRMLSRQRVRFNPRARVGRDADLRRANAELESRFNPRARVGRDPSSPCTMAQETKSFNPRARVGRDLCDMRQFRQIGRFNPRARVGRDR